MKKTIKAILLTCIVMLACVFLLACDGEDETHIHNFGEWRTVKNATCTAKGEEQRSCSCGEKEIQSIEAIGHTEVIDAAVSATCTEEGKTEGKHCSVCNAVIVKQETIAMLEHKEVEIKGQTPTATVSGYGNGLKCEVCQTTTQPQRILPSIREFVRTYPTKVDDESYTYGRRASDLISSINGTFMISDSGTQIEISLVESDSSSKQVTVLYFNSVNATLMTYRYGFVMEYGGEQYHDFMEGNFAVSNFYNLKELPYYKTSSSIGGSTSAQTERFDGYKSVAATKTKQIIALLDVLMEKANFGYGVEAFGFNIPSN